MIVKSHLFCCYSNKNLLCDSFNSPYSYSGVDIYSFHSSDNASARNKHSTDFVISIKKIYFTLFLIYLFVSLLLNKNRKKKKKKIQ